MNLRSRQTKRLAGALAGLGLALGLTLGATGTARADIPPPTSWAEIYTPYLNAQGITLCADDTNGSTANNNPAQLYHCHGYDSNGAPQRWAITPVISEFTDLPYTDNGHIVYYVYNLAGGHCLFNSYGAHNGPRLTMGPCQLLGAGWLLVTAPGTTGPDFQLEAAFDDPGPQNCAAADYFTGNNNTPLVSVPCSPGDTRQIFRLG